jgi:ATP-dependent DNA helicase RecQ
LDRCKQILIQYWGHSTFRPLQEEIIQSVLNKKDTLALMPTGGGKSITFQIPSLVNEGLCIVVTPLIALMKDQVAGLKKKGIKAVAVYSGMSREEIDIALDNCIYGDFKFLYCSPERLGTEIFRLRLPKMNVSLIAVDEAHCISQWGYDFRPSYLKIVDIREMIPDVPVLALTATATPEVVDDIMLQLKFKEKNVFRKSFERKNLVYVVRETEDKLNYILKVLASVKGSSIVYVRNRVKTKEIAQHLQKNGMTADFYHAGLTDEMRASKQEAWMKGKIRTIVSTNAFGMGIDKSDVRTVVHFDLPESPEAYFQEAGRAGRDEKKAYAVLLYNSNDKLSVTKRIETNFPEIKVVKDIYNALGNYLQIPYGAGKYMAYDFNLGEFAANYNLNMHIAFSSLKLLEQEGYIEVSDSLNNPAKVHFLVSRDDLYRFQVANVAFDTFIKLILRSYEGLFSNYVSIDEALLAKRSNTSVDNVYKYLSKLAAAKILHYIPRKKNPVVVYTEERLEDKAVQISYESYTKRRERYVQKIETMLKYASSQNKCRSQMLLSYFGEEDVYRCGQCDVCQKRNELDISKYEFDMIVEEIKKKLMQQPELLQVLGESFGNRFKEENVIKVIRWLLDNNKLQYNDDERLIWKH